MIFSSFFAAVVFCSSTELRLNIAESFGNSFGRYEKTSEFFIFTELEGKSALRTPAKVKARIIPINANFSLNNY